MNITTQNELFNPFLKRKEYSLVVDHGSAPTPTKASLQSLLAQQFKKPVENVDVVSIISETGMTRSLARVFVWDEKKVADLSQKPAQPEAKEA